MTRGRRSTHFAPAERAGRAEIARQVRDMSSSSLVSGLLETAAGLLAVLNRRRQILALNHALLAALRVRDPEAVLGLRPGEAIRCVHARDMADGCGTGKSCASCGAAIAIVSSLKKRRPVDQKCILTVAGGGETRDLCFRVKAHPFRVRKEPFLLLFLQDISEEERRAELERAFFHDLKNVVMGIQGASQMMAKGTGAGMADWPQQIGRMASRLQAEIAIQQALSRGTPGRYAPRIEAIRAGDLLAELRETVAHHPAARKKVLAVGKPLPRRPFRTDVSLLLRVLGNMLTNAFEATEEGGVVRLRVELTKARARFGVWNRGAIPPAIAPRVFQRYFSTKGGQGRGIGTYAMKLLGEEYLGGEVDFSSSPAKGTTFRITLPA